MPPDVRERAFEPFFTTKEVGKGTGLGLSQVHGLARQSGGTVEIESELGKGTTVRLYLPRAVGAEIRQSGDEAGDATSVVAENSDQAGEGPARVLIVDDDDEVREVVASCLRGVGHAVTEAASPWRALDCLDRGEHFHLVVVDYAMPGMNGIQFIDAARERSPTLKFMLLTGYADSDVLDAASGLPLLRKPFRLGELAERVRETLGSVTEVRGAGNVVTLARSPRGRERGES
jgi:CheY-like chemotaxis protein